MTEKHSPLLPCPFCGELPENDQNTYVHCANAECPACVETYGSKAVASWNTRAVNGLPEAIAALEDIVNPLGALKRYAAEQGRQIEGIAAMQLCNDPDHLRSIARAALTKLKG